MSRFFRAPPRIPTRADARAELHVTDSPSTAPARDHLLVVVATGAGLRVHELATPNWEPLVFEHGVRGRVHLHPGVDAGLSPPQDGAQRVGHRRGR